MKKILRMLFVVLLLGGWSLAALALHIVIAQGSPARVIRTLDEAAVEGLRRSARNYVANWQRFARDLKRID